jgi:hypothetical protein
MKLERMGASDSSRARASPGMARKCCHSRLGLKQVHKGKKGNCLITIPRYHTAAGPQGSRTNQLTHAAMTAAAKTPDQPMMTRIAAQPDRNSGNTNAEENWKNCASEQTESQQEKSGKKESDAGKKRNRTKEASNAVRIERGREQKGRRMEAIEREMFRQR